LTIPKYGQISLPSWPLTSNEAMLLNNIALAYIEHDDYIKAIEVSNEVYEAMKQSYMDEQQRVLYQLNIITNLSKYYGLIKNHHKAIELISEGIELCRKFKLGNVLPNLLYNMAWNIEQLIEMGELSPEYKIESLKYLKQAYYIALATQQSFAIKFTLKHITEKYGNVEEIISD
jgi:tetratricopeptide (TPR) repeat protein